MFLTKKCQNIKKVHFHNLYIALVDQIVDLTRKITEHSTTAKASLFQNDTFSLVGTIRYLMQSMCYIFVFQRHNSMETSIHPAFSCLNNRTC